MRLKLSIACFFVAQLIAAQITFIINELPDNHDYSQSIYISGDLEGWTGGQEAYKLQQNDDKSYSMTLDLDQDILQYKFTRGSWDTVEKDDEGNNTDNRIYKKSEGQDTIYVRIVNWDSRPDNAERASTAASNVTVLSEEFNMPQLKRKRRIWIYLPLDYKVSNERYPVLYIQDGQNVFDALTSYAGEWGVDETLNRLFRINNFKLIVVAIDNGGDRRMNEYSAWDNPRFGTGEGDDYLDFISKSLKPYIDINFRTLSDKDHTGIMGSSMGGLLAHYAAFKYSDVFGKAGVFSPSFWYANESYELAAKHSPDTDTKMYFLVGGNEGDTMVPDMTRMTNLMIKNGYKPDHIQKKIVQEGIHNETFWNNEFEEAVRWLFPEAENKREFVDAKLNGQNQMEIEVSDGNYIFQFYSPELVEATFIPEGDEIQKTSHAVVLQPKNLKVNFSQSEHSVIFKNEDLSVVINKQPFHISYSFKGQPVISEKLGYQRNDEFETIQLNLSEDEVLYGTGARALGMNRRGHRLQLYNRAHYGYETESALMNYTMPIVMSSKQFMIHFDNAPIGYLDLDSRGENTLTYETISGRKTYQVIVGDSWLDIINNYTALTGKQPMPPRWALGNFSSRFGYHSEKETRETVQKFRDENIPLDAVIIDIYWFGKNIQGHMGNLEWLRDSFPTPKQMIKDFKRKGVKTVLVTEPFILTTSKRWNEAVENDILAKDSLDNPFRFDFYFGNTGLIDIYNPKGKQWFWNIYKDLADQGVQGVWGDLGEPEVHPAELIHATGTANEVHNIYGHDWARLVYEGYQTDFPDQRPFILMRSGFSGSQRFGMIPWSGDVNRSWGGLQSQTEIALQMGMQGLGYMHSDLGGFAGANLDDELYTRWLQYGVFQPIFRPHAQEEVPSEPVFREPKTKALAKKSIELRYKLLPYNYTLAYVNHRFGIPLMRPLIFEEPENTSIWTNASTYLWGNDFLITPIVESGQIEKAVYFPRNFAWFDFYTDERIEGGQSFTVSTNEGSIPTYVRAGAFIPMTKVIQSTDDYSLAEFDLHYYHDYTVDRSVSQLYDDDGLTASSFELGQFELMSFNSVFDKSELKLEFTSIIGENYDGMDRNIHVIVHNINREPKSIRINGKKVKFIWNADNHILEIPVYWKTNSEVELILKFKK